MTKRADRRTLRRSLASIPEPEDDVIAQGCGVTIVEFGVPISEGILCHYCHTAEATTRDHIVARGRLGTDTWWNLVPSSIPCNRKKDQNPTTCHCAFCNRAVFLYDLGHKRHPADRTRPGYFPELHRTPAKKPKKYNPNKPFAIKADPLPEDPE